MTDPIYLLAIDQGTTSTRAIVFDRTGRPVASARREFRQIYPADGWVEHDPEDLWRSTVAVCRQVLAQCAERGLRVAALGITNQRETTVVWNRRTGQPVYNAIVWQDRRTAERCTMLREQGHEARVTATTGLLLDPYFSATKIAWILDHVAGARAQAERGELAFGTTDSFLIWRLTGGTVHATDATNASRTALFDIHRQCWSEDLLTLFGVPAAMLPEVRDSAADFGVARTEMPGAALPIRGVAGDQQAATVGQACFEPGMIKSTYGTGCFMLLNTGATPVTSAHRLLTTIAYRLNGVPHYALEGSIFNAGTALQWLRDGLGIIETAADSEALASALDSNRGVYLVPAFTGLGAPYWDPHARGALFGITRATGRAEFARAALESVCYQTHDLVAAMCGDGARAGAALRVDGGMVANDWLLQRLADTIAMPVERPTVMETTALGAACLAGLGAGVYGSLAEIAAHWQLEQRFTPALASAARDRDLAGWRRAVSRLQA